MLAIRIDYPTRDEERRIVAATTESRTDDVRPVLSARDVLGIQQMVRAVPASQHMIDYAVDLVRSTRPQEPGSPEFIRAWLTWGAGPRAAQNLILAAKARAVLHGRLAVATDDIRTLAAPVLRHRLLTNFNADAEGVNVEQIIARLLEAVAEPSYGDT
jgi:MoxR-like ATPase